MEDTGIEIDLYADMDSEFPKEDFKTVKKDPKVLKTKVVDTVELFRKVKDSMGSHELVGNDGSDLYDNALTNNKDGKTSGSDPENSQSLNSQGSEIRRSSSLPKRFQVYIGNLTWWTTDSDITNAVLDAGVIDFEEVKFFENKTNGQSKGYCCVTLASEASIKTLINELPKKELHGQTPIVTYATRHALNRFEAQQSTRPDQGSVGGHQFEKYPGYPKNHHSTRPYNSYNVPPPTWLASMGLPPPPCALPGGPTLPHGAHVNPAFFGPGGIVKGYSPGLTLSKAEFEEIMTRNRTVSSSAIARAVQDAAGNDFASAIETLITAISLIKGSKVAHDDRCRILIQSLQDTLHGIESKSYEVFPRESYRPREQSQHLGRPRYHSYSPRKRVHHESRRDYHQASQYRNRSYSRDRSRPRDQNHFRTYHSRSRSHSRNRSHSREQDYQRKEKFYEKPYGHDKYKKYSKESSESSTSGSEDSCNSGCNQSFDRSHSKEQVYQRKEKVHDKPYGHDKYKRYSREIPLPSEDESQPEKKHRKSGKIKRAGGKDKNRKKSRK